MQPVRGTRLISLTGLRFGRLTVLSRAPNGPGRGTRWLVRCDCGVKLVVFGNNLRRGATTSCGCYRKNSVSTAKLIDLCGRRFGRLIVLSRAEDTQKGIPRWKVQCDCGTLKTICGASLRSEATTSCGCYRRERARNFKLTQEDRDRRRLGSITQQACATIARKIRRRDRAICLACGAPNSTHVHHLEPWALDRGLRFSPSNLVTLCKECHNQFHLLYGKDAGLEDFDEFLLDVAAPN